MRALGGEAYAVSILAAEEDVSSTRIRELVAAGEVREAAGLLGRAYSLRGPVVAGDRRGRQIGFPTANVLPDPRVVGPGIGVYAGNVTVDGRVYGACTNVGEAPTFERHERRVEAYLLGFEGICTGRSSR
nr:riboflavin kinase [Rubrobacter marinus]